MGKIKLPSTKEVVEALRQANRTSVEDADAPLDVRLQVRESGTWMVHTGDAQYDTDHRGFWGASTVPGSGKRFDAKDTAEDLLDQVRESFYTSGDSPEEEATT